MDLTTAVAGLALVVSIVSAAYARRIARIEADRRREETIPRLSISEFTTGVEHPSVGTMLLAEIRNDGPDDVDEFHVELLEGPVTGLTLNPDATPPAQRIMAGSVRLGRSKPVLFVPAGNSSGPIRLLCAVHRHGVVSRQVLETARPPVANIW